MYFDKTTLNELFKLGETQLHRYRAAGLDSVRVKVRTGDTLTRRRLYSLSDVAHHLAKTGRKIPKGITERAKWYSLGIVTRPQNNDDDEPPPIPDTEAGRAFVLGFLCGHEDAESERAEDSKHRQRMNENGRAAWLAGIHRLMDLGYLSPDYLDGIEPPPSANKGADMQVADLDLDDPNDIQLDDIQLEQSGGG